MALIHSWQLLIWGATVALVLIAARKGWIR